MKVCTDACVFGAWADVASASRILDIGAGTGLLALMAAQRAEHASVDSVEIDDAAAGQAQENIAGSPFTGRIRIHHTAIQQFDPGERFDAILSNPPFFQQSLRSPDAGRNLSAHDDRLSLADLADQVRRLLTEDGTFFVLLPVYETLVLEKHLPDFSATRRMLLRHHPGKAPFRALTAFRRTEVEKELRTSPAEEILSVRDEHDQYTPEFVALLRDYYTIF
ncbi:tRNA1(Val) (adenine(37)-N6)-methyltransferase [Siphonobacter aquaeclarae]|nr:methyltransferase [Siphonobacter aquaeclarae]